MALRVLLADESVTIRKVFQIALQDYAVDVSSVTIGVDVLQVAEKFKPDIIFVDVILPKKNGYDVTKELKSHASFANTPVVLIWSGFMDLDREKYKASGANAHLEKPFDTQKLREIVQNLVPKTKSQVISNFLNFPRLPDFIENPGAPAKVDTVSRPAQVIPHAPVENFEVNQEHPQPYPTSPSMTPDKMPTAGSWTMDSFSPLVTPELEDVEEESEWVQKSISNYKMDPSKFNLDVPKALESEDSLSLIEEVTRPSVRSSTQSTMSPPPMPTKSQPEVINFDQEPSNAFALETSNNEISIEENLPLNLETNVENKKITQIQDFANQINEQQLEAIIRAQSQEVIERVVWQIIPDLAARIIEREIDRLLKERNKL
jgi:CheY-like chemotaxis protein